MAAIDKTYVSSWDQIKETIEWAQTVGTVIDDYGNEINPMWWLDDWDESYFNEWINNIRKENDARYKNIDAFNNRSTYYQKYTTYEEWCAAVDSWAEIPMWNTPTYFDIWLIRNCPVQFIQDRLHEQYDEYDEIKNHTSSYDTYKRVVGKHFTIASKKWNARIKDDELHWFIEVDDMWYNSDTDSWRDIYNEPGPWTSSATTYVGIMTPRKIARMIKRWKLPVGATLRLSSDYHRYCMNNLIITIKK